MDKKYNLFELQEKDSSQIIDANVHLDGFGKIIIDNSVLEDGKDYYLRGFSPFKPYWCKRNSFNYHPKGFDKILCKLSKSYYNKKNTIKNRTYNNEETWYGVTEKEEEFVINYLKDGKSLEDAIKNTIYSVTTDGASNLPESAAWYADESGSIIEDGFHVHSKEKLKDGVKYYYYSDFILQSSEVLFSYSYKPKNFIDRFLYKHFDSYHAKKNAKGNRKLKPLIITHHTYYSGGECIKNMVLSGDYGLTEAIWTYCTSCERCMNALEYKYTDGKDGYPKDSDEYRKCNTECDFCRGEK